MTATLSNEVATRLDEHLTALERLAPRASAAFVEHECPACGEVIEYVDAIERAVRGGTGLPARPDCLAADVGAVARLAHLQPSLRAERQARIDRFASAFAGLVELEAAPREMPLPAALGSTLTPALDAPHVLRPQ
ncbi:MAG TPA: hypothetical protein VFG69_15725, partial [Nannocystaceae bacterium]|nr:hypothetical protein [Nannocystaceae bacterium]